jgi:hypothetical protein
MKYGFIIPMGNPHEIAQMAQETEEAGWDGAFYYDGVCIQNMEMYDPWIVMTAMALKTSRVRLGAIVTPPSRRRPWKLARETMTLDHISNGRLVVPVGVGALDDGAFGKVGETVDLKERAEMMEESLEILDGLWSGKPFSYQGKHFKMEEMTFLPRPVQEPRIPIWVVGVWPSKKSMERVVRYDGILPQKRGGGEIGPEDIKAIKSFVEERRTQTTPFDIISQGETPGDDRLKALDIVTSHAEAGATWWVEARWSASGVDEIRERIRQGPPR